MVHNHRLGLYTRWRETLVFLLLFQLVYLLSLALNFSLILIYLLLLLVLRLLLSLQLITNEGSRSQPKSATNRRASSGMTNGCADQTSCGSAAQGTDSSSLFPC